MASFSRSYEAVSAQIIAPADEAITSSSQCDGAGGNSKPFALMTVAITITMQASTAKSAPVRRPTRNIAATAGTMSQPKNAGPPPKL